MRLLSLDLSSDSLAATEPSLFTSTIVPRHNWAPAAISSVVLHWLAIGCLIAVQTYLPLLRPESLDGLYAVSLIPLRASERLYYFVERPTPQPVKRIAARIDTPTRATPKRAGLRLPPQVILPP